MLLYYIVWCVEPDFVPPVEQNVEPDDFPEIEVEEMLQNLTISEQN